ncbi:MAG: TetR/AcrR family transcriptional regulator [Cyanobacteriota bacterium]
MSKEKLSTEKRKEQIAGTALRIIANDGLKKMTAIAIANEIGISDSTIFKHFKNKQEIVNAAIDKFENMLNSCYPQPEEFEKDPLERLGTFLMKRLELVKKHPEIIKLAFNERLTEGDEKESGIRVKKMVKNSVDFIIQCLQEAREEKKIMTLLPIKVIVWMIIGVLQGASQSFELGITVSESDSSKDNNLNTPLKVWQEIKKFLLGK